MIGEEIMKIFVAILVAFFLGTAFASSEAEARCWWNGYNHCRYYNGWHRGYGYYHYGYYHHGYWYR
jgi:hypothetical protein